MKASHILALAIFIVSLCGCSHHSTKYFKSVQHYKWDGAYTALSKKLNIDGCFYSDSNYDPLHFDNYGFVSSNGGYHPGVYKLTDDTIYVQLYSRWGPFESNWERTTLCLEIISPDSLKLTRYNSIDVGDTNFSLMPRILIFKRFDDCPEDLRIRDGFLRKQKWMWESEEARKQWEKNSKNK